MRYSICKLNLQFISTCDILACYRQAILNVVTVLHRKVLKSIFLPDKYNSWMISGKLIKSVDAIQAEHKDLDI